MTATAATDRRAPRSYLRRRRDLVAAGLALAVYLACAVVAARTAVPALEQELFHLVNGLPDGLRLVTYPVQLLGVLIVPALLAPIAAWRRQWRLAAALVLIPALKYAVEYGVVKQLVHRNRPFQSVCLEQPGCAAFRDVPLYGPSFVSGHAIIAAATAVVLLPYLAPRWRAVVVLLAVGVAVARVHLGAHNPLDVLGGAAVGVLIGSLLNLALAVPAPAGGRASDRAPDDEPHRATGPPKRD